jgi:hypothetical protein
MERGTCHYKKLKSQYIYLHLNPTESPTNTSPQPFWTKRGFEKVDAKLVIAPLTSTEANDPRMSNLHALKTRIQAEVLAALRDLKKLSPRDGKSSDTDQGLVAYYRAHHNPPLPGSAPSDRRGNTGTSGQSSGGLIGGSRRSQKDNQGKSGKSSRERSSRKRTKWHKTQPTSWQKQ